MLNLNSLLLSSANPKKLGEFYGKVFNIKSEWTDGDWTGFQVGNCHVAIGPHSEIKGTNKEPARIMLNLETTDIKGEFARIKKLGAKVVKAPYKMTGMDMDIATFADPDGNFFQLMSPMK